MRSSTLKFALVLVLSVAALSALVVAVPPAANTEVSSDTSYPLAATNEDRISFISKFGWTVDETPVQEVAVPIPDEFDASYAKYNELQLSQGLDLSKYQGKEAVKYTYNVTNFKDYDGRVYVNLIVCENKIIGGDVCSADSADFIYGFSGEKV